MGKGVIGFITILTAFALVAGCGGTSGEQGTSGDVNFAVLQAEGEFFIRGTVFNDLNGSGFMNTCEPPIEGVTMELKNTRDEVLDTTVTNSAGLFAFAVTAEGDYRLVETDLPGYASVVNTVTLMDVAGNVTVNFADKTIADSYGVCGIVFEDADGDMLMGMAEAGVGGVTVILSGVGDAVTDSDGIYAFAVTTTGPYAVTVTAPDGFLVTTANPVDINLKDSDLFVDFGIRWYMDVPLDVKPGSTVNPVNLRSRGVLPVAIFGSADVDVTQIDPVSIRLNGVAPLRWSFEDICTEEDDDPIIEEAYVMEPDGYVDLTLKFETQEVAAVLIEEANGDLARGDIVTLYLSGETADGVALVGQEQILIVQVPR